MDQADSVHSTPPTNTTISHTHLADATTSRRRFLSQAAGVAAGGTVLALATIPPAPAATAPASALASGEADPIFALIETHREAAWKYAAACAEQSRREGILIDEGIGLCPFVTMVWQGRPMVAHSHKQIDAYDSFSEKVRARAHAELDTTLERYQEVFGDIENEAGEVGDVALDALEDLITTPPASIAGLRALLTYLSEDVVDLGHQLDADKTEMLIHSIHDALLELNPSDAAGGMV